jgi:hypothetical protein
VGPVELCSKMWEGSDPHYVLGLQALGTLLHLELHFRALIQAPISIGLNGRKVNEDIVAAGPLDESVALRGVKPFHCTFFFHYTFSYYLFTAFIIESAANN